MNGHVTGLAEERKGWGAMDKTSYIIVKTNTKGQTEQYARNTEETIRTLFTRAIATKSLNGKYRSLSLRAPVEGGWKEIELYTH